MRQNESKNFFNEGKNFFEQSENFFSKSKNSCSEFIELLNFFFCQNKYSLSDSGNLVKILQ